MQPKARVKYFYEQVFSQNLLEEVANYIATDCVFRLGKQVLPVGIEGMKQHITDVRKTYPDLKITVFNQFIDGDFVISEIMAEGTHSGEFMNIAPTGKKLVLTGIDIDKVCNGKIVEHCGAVNTFETFMEAGIIRPHND